jgi:hypothetical protein
VPAATGVNARGQFRRRERFRDIVVRARIEPSDLVRLFTAGRQHDDRQRFRDRFTAQLSTDLYAGHFRQHPVEKNDVRRIFVHRHQGFPAVQGHIDLETLPLQIVAQECHDGCFVFDD